MGDWEEIDATGLATEDLGDTVLIETEQTELEGKLKQELASVKALLRESEASKRKVEASEAKLAGECEALRSEVQAIKGQSAASQTALEQQLSAKLAQAQAELADCKAQLSEALVMVSELRSAQSSAVDEAQRLRSEFTKSLDDARSEADARLAALEATHAQQLRSVTESSTSQKIAYRSLASGDLALFFPTTTGFYVAFTDGSAGALRHHYLSPATMQALDVKKTKPEWIVLELVEVAPHVASSDYNPYGLPVGTRFAELQGMRAG